MERERARRIASRSWTERSNWGINLIDTADVYGYDSGYGSVEELLGRWLAQGDGRRDAVVIATKVYSAYLRDRLRPEPNRQSRGIGAVKIHRQAEGSLRRLQTDVIDLYQMHHIDENCPWAETWQAFDTLRAQGKAIYIGSSNFGGWHIATACQEAERRGLLGLASEQSRYNLSVREPELEVIPACRHYGLGLLPWSPVAGGLLAGAIEPRDGVRRKESGALDALAQGARPSRTLRGVLPRARRAAGPGGAGMAAASAQR